MATKTTEVCPNRGMLAVELDDSPDRTPGGIFLPDTARDRQPAPQALAGTVFAAGLDTGYAVGCRVLVGGYDGHPCEVDGRKFRMVKDEDILGELIETE